MFEQVELNGIVFFINWKDVGKKKVEGSVLIGMDMKKWEIQCNFDQFKFMNYCMIFGICRGEFVGEKNGQLKVLLLMLMS